MIITTITLDFPFGAVYCNLVNMVHNTIYMSATRILNKGRKTVGHLMNTV